MERYFVDFKVHNGVNDGWAYKTELNTDDYDKALVKFFDVCKTYIGGTTFDLACVTLTDAFGNVLKLEHWQREAKKEDAETVAQTEDVE